MVPAYSDNPPLPPTRRMPLRRAAQAFTTLEILIVLSIIVIISGMVVPQLGSIDSTRLRAAADIVAADLSYAQVESLAHGDDLRIFIVNNTSTGYSIAPASATSTPITDPNTNQPYLVIFGQGRARKASGITFSAFSLGGDRQLKFGSFGQTDQATNATLTLSTGAKSVTLTIDANTGQVTIGPVQ